MFAPSSPSELPESHMIAFETNVSGVSSWEDLQRLSLGLMKCLESVESYASDSRQTGLPVTLSVERIKTKLGLANIALGRSMQSLLQSSFTNVHRGLNISAQQVPFQIQEADAIFEALPPISISRPGSRVHRLSTASEDDLPLSMANLQSDSTSRSTSASHSSTIVSNREAELESNTAQGSSAASSQQQLTAANEAPLLVASVAHRSSITALNGAAYSESNIAKRLESNIAKRSSAATSRQQLTAADGTPQSMATFQDSMSLQHNNLQGSSLTSNFESIEFSPSNDQKSYSSEISEAHQKNEIIAAINARVASDRHQMQLSYAISSAENSGDDDKGFESGDDRHRIHRTQYLSMSSVPSVYEHGDQVTKVRSRLSTRNGREQPRGLLASRKFQDSHSIPHPDFYRHLLGGGFTAKNTALNERGTSSGHPRDSGPGHNRHNPATFERPSLQVSALVLAHCLVAAFNVHCAQNAQSNSSHRHRRERRRPLGSKRMWHLFPHSKKTICRITGCCPR